MWRDFVVNTGNGFEGGGEVGNWLIEHSFDPHLSRPFIDNKGRHCIMVNTGRKDAKGNWILKKELQSHFMLNTGMVLNAPTALRRDEWQRIDTVVLDAARNRLRAWSDLASAATYSGFDGMGTMLLESESADDVGEALVDMDAMTEGRNFAPRFQPVGVPLPITHADFWFSRRKLAISRRRGTPLDTRMGAMAGRRIAEKIEDTVIGVETGLAFGDAASITRYGATPQVYGYTNFPERILKTDLTTPTGANPNATVSDVLEMREALYAANMYGPFMLYHTPAFDQFLDNDYGMTAGTDYGFAPAMTLRDRLRRIEGIRDVRRLDRWTGSAYQMVLVQLTEDVARAVIGMDITTVQWESMGGMRLNFKVMCIMVPELRAKAIGSDFAESSGILHATTS